MLRKITGVTNM